MKLKSLLVLTSLLLIACNKTVQPNAIVPFETGLWGGFFHAINNDHGVQTLISHGEIGFYFGTNTYIYNGSYYLGSDTLQSSLHWNGHFTVSLDSVVNLADAPNTILVEYGSPPTLGLDGNYNYKWNDEKLTIIKEDSTFTLTFVLQKLAIP